MRLLIKRIRKAQDSKLAAIEMVDQCKLELEVLFQAGEIPPTFSDQTTFIERRENRRWTYSPAVRELQDREKKNGAATCSRSNSWAIADLDKVLARRPHLAASAHRKELLQPMPISGDCA